MTRAVLGWWSAHEWNERHEVNFRFLERRYSETLGSSRRDTETYRGQRHAQAVKFGAGIVTVRTARHA